MQLGAKTVNLPTDTGRLSTKISVYYVGIKTLVFIIPFILFLGLDGLAQKFLNEANIINFALAAKCSFPMKSVVDNSSSKSRNF